MHRKIRLRCSQSYTVYYGLDGISKLTEFDLAVVEPSGQSKGGIHCLKKAGTLVLAYLSVVEISSDNPICAQLEADDYLNWRGKPVVNQVYQNRYVDLRSPRWRGTLLHLAGRYLLLEGYDGLFLDTIGNVEAHSLPAELRDFQMQAAVEFIKELKSRFPEHLLVQNNGLESLLDRTAAYIDGVCWENPPSRHSSSQDWVLAVTGKLRELQKKHGLKVLLLCEKLGKTENHADQSWLTTRQLAEENGFLFSLAPKDYLGIE